MEFTIFAAGRPASRVVPAETEAAARHTPCRSGEPCPSACGWRPCCAVAAARPVLDAFSPIISHERVRVESRSGKHCLVFEETGQRAALRLLVEALRHSGCPFFERFFPLPGAASSGRDYAAFVRLAVSLMRGTDTPPVGEGHCPDLPPDQADVICKEIEAHLRPLLAEARRRCRKDAAINAVVLMLSGSRLACDVCSG